MSCYIQLIQKLCKQFACITLIMNEIGQKIASKAERVHRVYLRHLIQRNNLCFRLFVKKSFIERMRRQTIRLRRKIALHYIIGYKFHHTAAVMNLHFDGTCRI